MLTISSRQSAAFTLSRQHLTQRSDSPLDVVRALVAIQTQFEASLPQALLARVDNLAPEWTAEAINPARSLVRTWTLRQTLHTLAADDLARLTAAVGETLRDDFLDMMKRRRGLSRGQVEALEAQTLDTLAAGPLSRPELHDRVSALASIAGSGWGLDVKGLAFSGDVVFADSDGGQSRFARRDQWLPELAWSPPDTLDARRNLLLRYLAAYGPASAQDFAYWTGLRMRDTRPIFGACAGDLLALTIDNVGDGYYIRREDEADLQAADEVPDGRMLPKFDALMLGYRNKTRFLDEAHYKRVFRAAAHVEAVVLIGGRAAGSWRMKQAKGRLALTVEAFRRLKRTEEKLIRREAERLAAFLGARDFEVTLQEV